MLAALAAFAIFAAGQVASAPGPEARALYDLIKQAEQPLSPATLDALAKGLESPSAQVRHAALATLHAFAFIGHAEKNRANPSGWRLERQQMLTLSPRIIRALDDPLEKIRHQAVLTLGTLDALVDDRGEMRTSAETLHRFARIFETDTAALVRYEIAKFFALAADAGPAVPAESVFLRALVDSHPGVIQMGATGIGNTGLARHLDRLVPLLRHPNLGVATAAALSFQKLAEHAAPFLQDLQQAAEATSDERLKQTLLGAIRLAKQR